MSVSFRFFVKSLLADERAEAVDSVLINRRE